MVTPDFLGHISIGDTHPSRNPSSYFEHAPLEGSQSRQIDQITSLERLAHKVEGPPARVGVSLNRSAKSAAHMANEAISVYGWPAGRVGKLRCHDETVLWAMNTRPTTGLSAANQRQGESC